jgi:hypothetical protein
MQLIGAGFIVERGLLPKLGMETRLGFHKIVREYRNGRDITQSPRGVLVIDLFGLTAEHVQEHFPEVFQHVLNHVKPQRDQNNRRSYRDSWWIHGEPRSELRRANEGLSRYIATVETSRHRFFVFLNETICPDNKLVAISLDSAFFLGVLSSKIHVKWSLATGSWLGVGNDSVYVKTKCFETFPFPKLDQAIRQRIEELAEQLDAHRKRQQEKFPALTMTGMYNVLEKLRTGEKLTAKEQTIHEQGLVSVLKQIHDDLDAAVFDAYGWSHDLDDEEILQRLVALNHERSEEESRGIVRWLRPEFQNPDGATQMAFSDDEQTKPAKKATTAKVAKQPWPKTLPQRMVAVTAALTRHVVPADANEIAAYYTRANTSQVTELLETLAAVGNVRQLDDGRYTVFK